MGRPRVKVVNPNEGWMGTEYYIDGKKIERVKSVDFRVAVDEVPQFTFETMGLPDIDMSGDIRFKFTPETVQQASVVLRNELMTRGGLYHIFLGKHLMKHPICLMNPSGCLMNLQRFVLYAGRSYRMIRLSS